MQSRGQITSNKWSWQCTAGWRGVVDGEQLDILTLHPTRTQWHQPYPGAISCGCASACRQTSAARACTHLQGLLSHGQCLHAGLDLWRVEARHLLGAAHLHTPHVQGQGRAVMSWRNRQEAVSWSKVQTTLVCLLCCPSAWVAQLQLKSLLNRHLPPHAGVCKVGHVATPASRAARCTTCTHLLPAGRHTCKVCWQLHQVSALVLDGDIGAGADPCGSSQLGEQRLQVGFCSHYSLTAGVHLQYHRAPAAQCCFSRGCDMTKVGAEQSSAGSRAGL